MWMLYFFFSFFIFFSLHPLTPELMEKKKRGVKNKTKNLYEIYIHILYFIPFFFKAEY